jgi:putative ABC transport system permease protein
MVVTITILIATLFISTVLMISTRERSSEIGALRAIGISRLTINKFIFKESLTICIIALIIGLILGYVASNIINDYVMQSQDYLPEGFKVTMITPNLIAQVTILTIGIALLASLGPIYWSMRLKPVETLRNE